MMFSKIAVSLLPLVGWMLPSAYAQSVAAVVVGSDDHTTIETIWSELGITGVFVDPNLNMTLFAPTDAAFEKIDKKYYERDWYFHLIDILKYHVTAGYVYSTDLEVGMTPTMLNDWPTNITSLDPPTINEAVIVGPDIEATNGVVHSIDRILLPPSALYTIADAVDYFPDLSTLNFLVKAANMTDALSGPGPLTLWAPTNAALAALGDADALIQADNKDELANLLAYHVGNGMYTAKFGIKQGEYPIPTLSGDDIILTIYESPTMNTTEDDISVVASKQGNEEQELPGNYKIDFNFGQATADLVYTDLLLSNGIIHLIDAVLTPINYTKPEPPKPEDADDEMEEDPDMDDEEDGPEFLGTIENVGNNGVPEDVFPLAACKGDCDGDDECAEGLTCVDRNSPSDPVSIHCEGAPDPEEAVDYCFPSDGDMKEPQFGEGQDEPEEEESESEDEIVVTVSSYSYEPVWYSPSYSGGFWGTGGYW